MTNITKAALQAALDKAEKELAEERAKLNAKLNTFTAKHPHIALALAAGGGAVAASILWMVL